MLMPQLNGRLPWARVVVEGGTIVLSILLAFGIDAWWAQRGDRQHLAAALDAVREEFEADRELLVFQLSVERLILAGIDEVVAAMEPALGSTVMIPDTLLAAAMIWAPTFDPPTAALDALISSGEVDRVQDPKLRSVLRAWPSALADVREEQLGARTTVAEQLWAPLLASFEYRAAIDRSNEFWAAASAGLRPGTDSPVFTRRSVTVVAVPAELRMINALMLNRYWLTSIIAELELLQGQLDEVLRLLDAA